MTNVTRDHHPAAPWLWAALTLLAWFASLFAALPVAGAIAALEGGSGDGAALRWDLAALLAINGALGMAMSLAIGRWIFGRRLELRPVHLVLPLIGVALAIAVELALHRWAEFRFGYYDTGFVSWTAGLSLMVVLCGIAALGVVVAPRGALGPPLIGLGVAASIVWLIGLSNVAGIVGGIDPESWPLAFLVGSSGLYAAAVVAVGLARALRNRRARAAT